jgi:hypothetical protein
MLQNFSQKTRRNRSLGRKRRRKKDNIEVDLKRNGMGRYGLNSTGLRMVQLLVLVNNVISLRVL